MTLTEKKELRKEVHTIQNERGRYDRDSFGLVMMVQDVINAECFFCWRRRNTVDYPDPVIVIRKYKIRESYSF